MCFHMHAHTEGEERVRVREIYIGNNLKLCEEINEPKSLGTPRIIQLIGKTVIGSHG